LRRVRDVLCSFRKWALWRLSTFAGSRRENARAPRMLPTEFSRSPGTVSNSRASSRTGVDSNRVRKCIPALSALLSSRRAAYCDNVSIAPSRIPPASPCCRLLGSERCAAPCTAKRRTMHSEEGQTESVPPQIPLTRQLFGVVLGTLFGVRSRQQPRDGGRVDFE
jgi:hypothetical protein